jgi:hypothetical protein
MKTSYPEPCHTAARLREIMTTPPISAKAHADLQRRRTEARRIADARRDARELASLDL